MQCRQTLRSSVRDICIGIGMCSRLRWRLQRRYRPVAHVVLHPGKHGGIARWRCSTRCLQGTARHCRCLCLCLGTQVTASVYIACLCAWRSSIARRSTPPLRGGIARRLTLRARGHHCLVPARCRRQPADLTAQQAQTFCADTRAAASHRRCRVTRRLCRCRHFTSGTRARIAHNNTHNNCFTRCSSDHCGVHLLCRRKHHAFGRER